MTGSALYVNCTVVDVRAGAGIHDAALWVRDGTIAGVGAVDEVLDQADPDRDEVTDLGGRFVTPGLINLHVHLGLALPGGQMREHGTETKAELALRMAANAGQVLEAGVTTVRCVGEKQHVDFALRRAIDAGQLPGPRIYTAGRAIVSTGGHGHDHGAAVVDGPTGFRRATRAQLGAGADVIKVIISGGIAGEHEQIHSRQITGTELRAVTETAHGWGVPVTAHAGPADAIAEGLEAGLDGIEHGYQLTADVVSTMAAEDVWYVPTILVSRCEDFYDEIGVPDWMADRALGAGEAHLKGLRMAIEAGVPIALGTDMPPAQPTEGTTATVRELEHYVDAGMTATEALRAATIRAAECLQAADELGSLETGKDADLLVVARDPLDDISALREIEAVVKGGQVVHGSLPGPPGA